MKKGLKEDGRIIMMEPVLKISEREERMHFETGQRLNIRHENYYNEAFKLAGLTLKYEKPHGEMERLSDPLHSFVLAKKKIDETV